MRMDEQTRFLTRLLDMQRSCLVSGQLSELTRSQKALEGFLLQARQPELDADAAKQLREKIDRNARLIEAALAGLKTARSRIARYGGPAPEFTTYTDPR